MHFTSREGQCLQSVPFDAVYSRVVSSAMSIDWSTLRAEPQTSLSPMVCDERRMGWQNCMKLSLLTSHASVCNTTMVDLESGDTVEREC
ncbi:hypothetical protein TNCV_433561 [Trichonephila clavipes]|nr:hypothetical protein TNCV_433561 [Trichonephila clavipes]